MAEWILGPSGNSPNILFAIERGPVEEILWSLRKHKHVLIGPMWPIVRSRFTQAARPLPNYCGPQSPARLLHGKRYSPGKTDERFPREAKSRTVYRSEFGPCQLASSALSITSMRAAFRIIVGIANIQKERPSFLQNPAQFFERLNERINVGLDRRFVADLALVAIIALPEIRWRGYSTVDRFGWQ